MPKIFQCHRCITEGNPQLSATKRYVECKVCGVKGPQRDPGKKKNKGKAAIDAWNFYSEGLLKNYYKERPMTRQEALTLMTENIATLQDLAKRCKAAIPEESSPEFTKKHGLWMSALGRIDGWLGARSVLQSVS